MQTGLFSCPDDACLVFGARYYAGETPFIGKSVNLLVRHLPYQEEAVVCGPQSFYSRAQCEEGPSANATRPSGVVRIYVPGINSHSRA
jgi:hypothetical protein